MSWAGLRHPETNENSSLLRNSLRGDISATAVPHAIPARCAHSAGHLELCTFVPRCIRSASRRAHTAPLSQRARHQHNQLAVRLQGGGGQTCSTEPARAAPQRSCARSSDLRPPPRARARCASAILRPLQRPATVLLNSKPPPARRSLSQAARPRALALFKLALPAVRQLAPRNNVTSVTAAGRRCNRGWRRRAMQEERRRSGPRTSCYGCGRRTRSGRACKCADTCGVS